MAAPQSISSAAMLAVEISIPGGPEVLKVVERPIPEIEDSQVLIKVSAAGINRPDCLQREGLYPPPKGASDIPGLEVAGTVVAIGGKVTKFKIDDKVMALVTGGGYSEFVVAQVECVLTIPAGLSMVEAAAIPETFFTVWHNVFQRGGLVEGETILIHGGSSGIGTTAIQLAKCFGAKVIVTVGSAQKCRACLDLGADHAINYKTQDFVEEVKAISNDNGVELILDMVGGSYIERNYKAAAIEGCIVQIAFLQGPKVEVNFMPLMLKRLTHTGSTMRARDVEFKNIVARELQEQVWPLIEQGEIKPIIDQVFDLKDVVSAHQRIEEPGHIGKIVLSVDGDN